MTMVTAQKANLWLLIFNATTWLSLAEDKVTSPTASLHVSLHTAWPGLTGDQTTSEAAYSNYARQPAARTSGGWTVSNDNVSNAAAVAFPAAGATGVPETEAYFGVGVDLSGTGTLLFSGLIGPTNLGNMVVEAADLAGNDLTIPGHGLSGDERIAFFDVQGDTLPTGITEGTVYWVLTAGITADTLNISTSSGGAEVDVTAIGAGAAFVGEPLVVNQNVAPNFAIEALDLFLG